MRTIYRQAEQGHKVPSTVMPIRGPFAPYQPKVVGIDPDTDAFPPGATAQNGMTEVVLYQCRICDATVRESELDTHKCEE